MILLDLADMLQPSLAHAQQPPIQNIARSSMESKPSWQRRVVRTHADWMRKIEPSSGLLASHLL